MERLDTKCLLEDGEVWRHGKGVHEIDCSSEEERIIRHHSDDECVVGGTRSKYTGVAPLESTLTNGDDRSPRSFSAPRPPQPPVHWSSSVRETATADSTAPTASLQKWVIELLEEITTRGGDFPLRHTATGILAMMRRELHTPPSGIPHRQPNGTGFSVPYTPTQSTRTTVASPSSFGTSPSGFGTSPSGFGTSPSGFGTAAWQGRDAQENERLVRTDPVKFGTSPSVFGTSTNVDRAAARNGHEDNTGGMPSVRWAAPHGLLQRNMTSTFPELSRSVEKWTAPLDGKSPLSLPTISVIRTEATRGVDTAGVDTAGAKGTRLTDAQHTNCLRRRSSFDAYEVRRNFERQIRQRGLRLRRRKTESESTLLTAAEEVRQLDALKKSSGKDKTCPVVLRRSSTLSHGELDYNDTLLAGLSEPYRKFHRAASRRLESLWHFSKVNISESFPSSATGLLTGGQTVQDRLLLFWHLERIVNQQHSNGVGELYNFRRNSCVATSGSGTADTFGGHEETGGGGRKVHKRRSAMEQRLSCNCKCGTRTAVGQSCHSLSTCRLLGFLRRSNPKRTSKLSTASGCHCISHPDKVKGGEDAHFAMDGIRGVMGVADGVGQWSEFGCDARLFARDFAEGCFHTVMELTAQEALMQPSTDATPSSKHLDTAGHKEDILELPTVPLPRSVTIATARGRAAFKFREVLTSSKAVSAAPLTRCSPSCYRGASTIQASARQPTQRSGANPSLKSLRIMHGGFSRTTKVWGASTALVASLSDDGSTLGVANLGDSSIIILRRDLANGRLFTVIRKTKEQQHSFNCPYQISRLPQEADYPILVSRGWHTLKTLLHQMRMANTDGVSSMEGDSPEASDLYDIRVQEGDLVILGTDGVFDNLFDHEISHLVSLCISPYEAQILSTAEALSDATSGFVPHPHFVTPPKIDKVFGIATPPKDIAKALAEAAFFRSVDRTARTPFSRGCKRAGQPLTGGKMDDITVIASWILRPEDDEDDNNSNETTSATPRSLNCSPNSGLP